MIGKPTKNPDVGTTSTLRAKNEIATDRSGSIRELGRYRSFLRLQAMGIAPRLKSKVEASDIVQQTMLDAHEKIDQFRGQSEGEMAKWLSQILANNIADAVRAWHRQKRDVRREQPLERPLGLSSFGANDWLQGDQTSPSMCVDRAEQMLGLSEAIQQLPEAQQQVIIYHHLQSRSLNEVAELVQKSPSAVAGLLYRGLKSLRKLLAN